MNQVPFDPTGADIILYRDNNAVTLHLESNDAQNYFDGLLSHGDILPDEDIMEFLTSLPKEWNIGIVSDEDGKIYYIRENWVLH